MLFLLLSTAIVLISYKNVMHPNSHGFPRMFGWIGIAWLFDHNRQTWFDNPLSALQLGSWILLVLSVYLVFVALIDFRRFGKINSSRQEHHLFFFEKTTNLIDQGIYRFIRHPMYASLISLTWGTALKMPELPVILVASLCSFLFYLTARMDEKECLSFFGEDYQSYKNRSKMFVPFVF